MAQCVAYGFYLYQKVSNMVLGFFPPYVYSAIPCSLSLYFCLTALFPNPQPSSLPSLNHFDNWCCMVTLDKISNTRLPFPNGTWSDETQSNGGIRSHLRLRILTISMAPSPLTS